MSAAGHAAGLAVDRSSCSPLSMISDTDAAGIRFGVTIVGVFSGAGFAMSADKLDFSFHKWSLVWTILILNM